MRSGWRPWTKNSILVTGLVVIGAAMAFFGHRTYRIIEKDLSTAAESGRTSISVLAATTLTLDFQRMIDVDRSLATRVRFTELVANGRWQEAAQIMATVPRDFAAIEQILIIDVQGNLQAAIPESGLALGRHLADREWVRQSVASSKPYISNVESGDQDVNQPMFFVTVPVLKDNGQLSAVLALRISTQRFLTLFAQLPLEPDGSIHVIDRLGVSAFNSADPMGLQISDWANDPSVQRVLQGESGAEMGTAGPLHTTRSGATFFSTFAPTSFGWSIVTQWPTTTVFAARDDELRRVAIGFTLIVAMTIAAVFLTIRLLVERQQTETERRANSRLESRVQERTAELENMNRELESFSYSISHDLRAPLRAIDGFSTLLVEDYKAELSSNAKRYVDNVHRNVVHMARLIDELLELSRVGRVALEYRQIDMNSLVNELLPTILAEHQRVSVNTSALPLTRGDATLIRQVWTNLVDNAAKYSSQVDAPKIDISGAITATESVYCVADNGVGFDMLHYDRLFKPFSRLHSPGKFAGTGVGLAIVKRIIERHDGRIWAQSSANQGTKVFFALPLKN
jgi:signal transduction histidine kinase